MGLCHGQAGPEFPYHDSLHPSISSPSDELETPNLLSRTNLASPGLWAGAMPVEPGVSREAPAMPTPDELNDEPLDMLMMSATIAGALNPTEETSSPTNMSKMSLRLPSFETLGIANPHPDRLTHSRSDGTLAHPTQERMLENTAMKSAVPSNNIPLQTMRVLQTHPARPRLFSPQIGLGVHSNVKHFVSTLTPPAEPHGEVHWQDVVSTDTAPSHLASTYSEELAPRPVAVQQFELPQPSGTQPSIEVEEPAPVVEQWIKGAVDVLLSNLRTSPEAKNPLRVLSHALPSPSPEGHVFPDIISALHVSSPTSPTAWVNVFHAVPGRFNLADLPTSPPSTPGPAIGGEDYFTQKVFDSAVAVPDYQADVSSLPRSPRPVVPPSSIDISIVERYIPPVNAREFSEMFSVNGPSILVDRLVELSPSNGCLTFIYPTKAGAHTFLHDYLSPVLDPLLRSTVVINGLSAELCVALGGMPAADQLPDYHTLEQRMATLCERLTAHSSSIDRFYGRRANFEIAYASKRTVDLPRQVWASHWWSKQEKPRIREAVTRYAQEAQKKSSNEFTERGASPTELIQQLLDGIAKKPYPEGKQPSKGVEVGVFVIRRSA